MKKHLLFLITFTLLFTLFPIKNAVLAENNTEVISAADSYEFSAIVNELTNTGTMFYTEDNCDFPSNRIIVLSDSEFDYCGAELAVNDSNGMYVLFYNTKSEAETGYNKLLENPYLDVIPDIKVSVPTDEDDNTYDVSLYSSHLSWGPDYIGTDTFIETLYNNYDTVDNMPQLTVAVIDTGVDYNHPFLAGRITTGYDYVNGDKYPMDDHSHGTHVAGIICDNTLSNVNILAYKTLDSEGNGSFVNTLSAVFDAERKGADIINLSLGAVDSSQAYLNEYASVYNNIIDSNGIAIVAAAGNKDSYGNQDANKVFPANMDKVITVSACKKNGDFADSYSNYGPTVDICAPGTSIYSTVLNSGYGYKTGTSMACPFTTAAAALLKTAKPDLNPREIETHLKDGANYTGTGTTGYDQYYGYGLLNLTSLAKTFLIEKTTELPSLCSATLTDTGHITINVKNTENVLSGGATLLVAGYNNKNLLVSKIEKIYGEYTDTFSFPEDIDTAKIYIWDYTNNQKPLSKVFKLDKGDNSQ